MPKKDFFGQMLIHLVQEMAMDTFFAFISIVPECLSLFFCFYVRELSFPIFIEGLCTFKCANEGLMNHLPL